MSWVTVASTLASFVECKHIYNIEEDNQGEKKSGLLQLA